MPKARRRKNSEFQTSMTKSVFLYGEPNQEKLATLKRMQTSFAALVNHNIEALIGDPTIVMQLVKNDKKDSYMRALEKSMRPKGMSSAFCQNAFDVAVTHLSNRLDNIRLDLLSEDMGIFAKSKVLFAMSIIGNSRKEMTDMMKSLKQKFHQECASLLEAMSDNEFSDKQSEFTYRYAAKNLEYRTPVLRNVSVPLDSRLMRIEKSYSTVMPYVIMVTDPENSGCRITVPINTSKHSLHKIASNHMAGTVVMQTRNNKLRIGWSYNVTRKQPAISEYIGVDTGITDSLYTSDNQAIGSMNKVLDFYKNEVEPAFAELADLRNKKRSIGFYLRHHDLPDNVRRSLIAKMDRLDRMMQTMEAPYRKKRHYYQELNHEIKSSVHAYIDKITPNELTVIEKLDIKEFRKSRKLNGKFSTFARGKLQWALIQTLNWKEYDFLEVAPDFTSQLCPVCNNLDPENRHHKEFLCACCGHKDDADHVGAVNIRDRAQDTEVIALCEKYRYNHSSLQKSLKAIYAERHKAYQQAASA